MLQNIPEKLHFNILHKHFKVNEIVGRTNLKFLFFILTVKKATK